MLHDRAKRFVVGVVLRQAFDAKEAAGTALPLQFVVLDELNRYAPRDSSSPIKEILLDVAERGRLPVVNFSAGGLATPADAALMMQLGAEGVFVGSGIFKSEAPAVRAAAIVEATTHFDDPERVARASRGLGAAMAGLEIADLEAPGGAGLMQHR